MIGLLLLLAAPPAIDPPGVVDAVAEAAWDAAVKLRRGGRAREAADAFVALAELHPRSRRAPQALSAAGTLARWELGDVARAKALWVRALSGPSDVPGVDGALNELLALERELGGARRELALLLELAPRRAHASYQPRLYLRAATILLDELSEPARALELARAAVRVSEETTWWDDAALLEARALSALGRREEAIAALRRITASQRTTLLGGDENSDLLDDAYLGIAVELERAGRLADAVRAYERLADEVPESVWVDDALAAAVRLSHSLGDAGRAAELRARLVKLRPGSRHLR